MSECPTGCGRQRTAGHLLCKTCWTRVPPQLQTEVNQTWRKYRAFTGIEQSPERRAARLAYQEARDAAITMAGL